MGPARAAEAASFAFSVRGKDTGEEEARQSVSTGNEPTRRYSEDCCRVCCRQAIQCAARRLSHTHSLYPCRERERKEEEKEREGHGEPRVTLRTPSRSASGRRRGFPVQGGAGTREQGAAHTGAAAGAREGQGRRAGRERQGKGREAHAGLKIAAAASTLSPSASLCPLRCIGTHLSQRQPCLLVQGAGGGGWCV